MRRVTSAKLSVRGTWTAHSRPKLGFRRERKAPGQRCLGCLDLCSPEPDLNKVTEIVSAQNVCELSLLLADSSHEPNISQNINLAMLPSCHLKGLIRNMYNTNASASANRPMVAPACHLAGGCMCSSAIMKGTVKYLHTDGRNSSLILASLHGQRAGMAAHAQVQDILHVFPQVCPPSRGLPLSVSRWIVHMRHDST